MRMQRVNWTSVVEFLAENSGKYTYGSVAAAIGTSARAVGSMMRAIYRRGYDDLCERVVLKTTGQPGYAD